MGMYRRVDHMRPPTDEHAHLAGACQARAVDAAAARLAGAFLALVDEPRAERPQRSAPRALCALAAGVVFALAVPLAWMSPAPRDQPAATIAGKAAGVEIDDEDADGPWPSA
jgi:hypothetical protein